MVIALGKKLSLSLSVIFVTCSPFRGQQVKQVVAGVEWILDYVFGSAEVARAGSYMQTGQRAASNLLDCVDDSLPSSPVCCRAPHAQHCNAVRLDALYGGTSSLSSRLFFLRTLRKSGHCWVFFTTAVVLTVQKRSSEICPPRNLKEWTLSTHSSLMMSGAGSTLPFLKSMIISFVFVVFSKIVC